MLFDQNVTDDFKTSRYRVSQKEWYITSTIFFLKLWNILIRQINTDIVEDGSSLIGNFELYD